MPPASTPRPGQHQPVTPPLVTPPPVTPPPVTPPPARLRLARHQPARSRRAWYRAGLAAFAVPLLLAGTGCGSDSTGSARVDVVAAFYPLEFVATRVGGDAVSVISLTKPGAEPHDLELNPRQVGQVTDADLVVYLKGFQPAIDDAVAMRDGDGSLDATTTVPLLAAQAGEHEHESNSGNHEEGQPAASHPTESAGDASHRDENASRDPHVWMDPTRLATIGDALAARLGTVDPDGAAGYTARAAALRAELEGLDKEFAAGLKTCQRRELVVSHTAFSYLADRYGLEQISVSGLSPEEDPSPRRLAEVASEARLHKATTIFFETLVSPKVAETLAREIGAKTAVLDPIEGLQPGSKGDYLSVMRTNLATLRPALGCA